MAVLERRTSGVEVHGGIEESSFSIMASAEAFEILSDRIYPNKIKAVVRELSTNAVDATIDARKVAKLHKLFSQGEPDMAQLQAAVNDNAVYIQREYDTWKSGTYDLSNWQEKQPVVHLPNSVEPFFSIRDFGTGLSHEFVMKLYTTYFWSDKKTSNDYTGCLGLGSKSPFAYTDHFTVTSYWNGEKRSYNAHLSDKGFPAITIFTDDDGQPLVFPTDEPNGVEVSFAVRAGDFREFYNEAKQLYPYFKVPLAIIGNAEVRQYLDGIYKSKEAKTFYKLESEGDFKWGIRPDGGYITGARAIMGNIAYPISLQDTSGLSWEHTTLLGKNIDLLFPVGSLQITPSRESLSYKPSTVKAIKDAILGIPNEIIKQITVGLNDQKTLWEARCFARKIMQGGEFSFAFNNNKTKLDWNGTNLTDINSVEFDAKKWPGLVIYKFHPSSKKRSEVNNLPCVENIRLFEIDLPRGSFARCELDAAKNGESYAVEFKTIQMRKDFLAHMGMEDTTVFTGTSTLPKPVASQRTTYGSSSQVFTYIGNSSRRSYRDRNYNHWEAVGVEFDLNDGGVYVEMTRYKIIRPDGTEANPHTVGHIIKYLSELGHNVNVIGVRNKLVKKFRKSDDWVDLFTYAMKVIEQDNLKHNINDTIVNRKELDDFYREYDRLERLLAKQTKVSDGILKDFLVNLSDVSKTANKMNDKLPHYTSLAAMVDYKFEEKPIAKLGDEFKKVVDKYPLLTYAMNSGFTSSYVGEEKAMNHFIKYVEAVDNELVA